MAFKEKEVWKVIPNYPNYKISNYGRVLSLNYNKTGKVKLKKFGKRGDYLSVYLLGKTISVHRIVAKVFCSKKNGHECVNHLDGNKKNNFYKNLEWCTYSRNVKHSYDFLKNKAAKGEKNGGSKLTENQVLEIKKMIKDGKTGRHIAGQYNVSPATISRIKNNRKWKHLNKEIK